MRFKTRTSQAPSLEQNLVPMLDVLMTVLTFFVIVSMVLTAEKGVNVSLTGGENQPTPDPQENLPDPLVVELNPQGQVQLKQQPLTKDNLTPLVAGYLAQNPKGAVLLKADRDLPYEQVVTLLSDLQQIGGDRVSLAMETASEVEAPLPGATKVSPTPVTSPATTSPSAATSPAAATTTGTPAGNSPDRPALD